jgi:Carboxypeptidase regulatory-like domain/TonB dependent receptor/TonB-dependent Receptor Plug Domain
MLRTYLPASGRCKIRTAGAIECLLESLVTRAAGFMNLICVVVALAALTADVVRAQTPGTGAISGVVVDPSGAAVGNAKVTIADREIHIERSVTTAADGSFRCSLLPLGAYSITVNAAGFAQEDLPAVAVLASETTTVAFKLKLGAGKTVIEVSEAVDMAQTESAALGRALDERKIVSLPLANRNFSQILALSPGVVVGIPNAAAFGKNTQNVSVNGAKTTANNFQFDGIDANNLSENSASGFAPEPGIAIPAPDTIAEFKVQTAMYDAGYGRSSGANVDVVSRSGSNRLHGELWEFFRNDALNANDFFLNQNAQPRPVLRQNQFGGTIGGPIRRDKTFFFGSYQGSLQTNGQAPGALASAFLPPLTDDRSAAALGQIFAGQSGAFGGAAVAPDGSNINPVALALLNFKLPDGTYAIPTPQTILPGGVGESIYSIPGKYREDQFSVNLDHNFSPADRLAGRYFFSQDSTNQPFTPFAATVPGWGTTFDAHNGIFVLSEAHTFASNLTNLARFGYTRFNGLQTGANAVPADSIGMATPTGLATLPGIQIQGLFTIGSFGEPFYFQNTNTFVWQDTVSLTHGRHNFRMGGEAKRHQLILHAPFVTSGFLLLQSFPDFLLGQSAAQNGSSFSNLFQSTGASGNFRKDQRYTDWAGFFQDDIRISPRLTLNAGLRYEYFGPPTEIHGYLSSFDPSLADPMAPPGGTFSGIVVPLNLKVPIPDGVTRSSRSTFWNPDYKDFSPRLGFAWRLPTARVLVLRGGYGIYYERLSGELVLLDVGQQPFSLTQALLGSLNAAATLQQPFVPPLPPTSAFPIFIPRTPDSALAQGAIARNIRSPYTQQYNLGLQFEFARDFLWEAAFVGSKTTHLAGCVEFNQARLATPEHPINGQTETNNENIAARLPFQGLAGGSYICQTSFDANYNSLQTSLTKRTSHGLDFLVSYTFAKVLDYTSGTGGIDSLDLNFLGNDQTDPRSSRGPSDFDRKHRFVASFTYRPPTWRSAPLVVRRMLSNWQLSGVTVLQSGLPITVVDSLAGSVFGNLVGFSRAECSGLNPAASGSVTSRLNGYFNPAAFSSPPTIGDGTGFGNCGVGILRGPGQRNLDLGVQRTFPLAETASLDFRAEFFNFTNTPKFGQPFNDFAAGPGAPFGVISSTVGNPRIIQFALKLHY